MNKRPRASTPASGGTATMISTASPGPDVEAVSPPRFANASVEVVASPNRDMSHVANPPSPATNRDRFRASLMPAQITCDLSCVTVDPGHRFTFQGIVLVVFPSSANPVRRHVLVGDGRGVVGITVWNAHVNTFSSESVGQLLVVTKVSIVVHNGTRGITLNKESGVSFNTLADHFASSWWLSIPKQPALSAILFCDQKENAVVNVAGILGSVSVEQKTVRSDARDLVTIKLVDRTGITTLRTWNHNGDTFLPYVDSPVMFQRVRVTSFASMKTGELFDGSGTVILKDNFDGAADLKVFWSE
jgi:hypothetical protein